LSESEANQNSAIYETPAETASSKAAFVKRWVEAIELASSEEKDWRATATEARNVYESDDAAVTGTAFNIYHANIETICPALYNSTPAPDIRRRFNDKDPAAKAGADCIERALSYSVDEYDFDGVMNECVFDLAVTGRGVGRVVYEASDDGMVQEVSCETVPWAAFRRGPARNWKEVQWVAFANYMTRDALKKLSPEHGAKVTLDTLLQKDGTYKDGAAGDTPEDDIFKRAMVWTVWDREAGKVRFIAPGYTIDQLAVVDDPLGLKGFFPMPKPMMSGKPSGRLVPLAPYKIYKPLLGEIDELTKRIKRLIKQLRPRALGPSGVDVSKWADADDGEIVEASESFKIFDGAKMADLLSWFPMDPVVKAIESLFARREQAKMELFEVSGLSDIIRGQSNANETATAQNIKQQWGSLRLQKSQSEVQRFARDLMRLKAEIIAEKFTPENLAMMTGVELGDEVLKVITDDKMRSYRIDIETDSTIRGDLTRNQEAMAQFVGGSAQYFSAIAPIVESGGMSKTAAVTIYSAFARNFKLGKEVDAVLDHLAEEAAKAEQAAAGQPPPENPEVIKAKAEAETGMAKQQSDAAHQQVEDQAKLVKANSDAQVAVIKANAEAAANKQQQFDDAKLKRELALEDVEIKRQVATADVAVKAYLSMVQQSAANQIKAAETGAKLKEKAGERAEKSQGDAQLAKGMAEMGKAIVAMGENILKAQTAPRTVKTPDGRTYTSKVGN
jgi:hypothetical protein